MNKSKKKKVIVALSGGVDSSAAALLLKNQGYEVIGIFMRLIDSSEVLEAGEAAKRAANFLKIPFYPIDLTREFKKEVIDYFLDSYDKGITPNPCTRCNPVIKFGKLLEKREELGADFLATGHYSQKHASPSGGSKFNLMRGKDKTKDQSYFLYGLTEKQLAKIIFPLGELEKNEVKKMVDTAGIPYLKKESQDICFLTGDHNDFLREHLKMKKGLIKDVNGKVLGEHQGLPLYTLGQRRGIEIGGTGPYYVVELDYKTNTLIVSNKREDKELLKREFRIRNANWIGDMKGKFPLPCQAVIRYQHPAVACQVLEEDMGTYLVKLSAPVRAITPGQSAVFYEKDIVLGGGEIV